MIMIISMEFLSKNGYKEPGDSRGITQLLQLNMFA